MLTIKGILTNCITGRVSEVELEYEIRESNGLRIFQLLNGVTGYESFYIDDWNGKLKTETIERMKKNGWRANVGTKGVYDELFIPSEEMQKALQNI